MDPAVERLVGRQQRERPIVEASRRGRLKCDWITRRSAAVAPTAARIAQSAPDQASPAQ